MTALRVNQQPRPGSASADNSPAAQSTRVEQSRVTAIAISLLCGLGVTLLQVLLGPYYALDACDDAVITLRLSGVMNSGIPDPQVLYIHTWLCQFLAACYRLFPGWDWYATHLLIALGLANSAWYWALSQGNHSVTGKWLWTGLMGLVALRFSLPLQFTHVAYWLAAGGCALIFSELGRALSENLQDSRRFPWSILLGVLLVLWANLLRYQICELVGFFAAITIAYGLLWARLRWFRPVYVLIAVGLVAGLQFSQSAHFQAYHTTPELTEHWNVWQWMGYLNNDDRLHPFPGNPAFEHPGAVEDFTRRLSTIEWSLNDWRTLNTCFFDERDLFSADRLERAYETMYAPLPSDSARFQRLLPGSWIPLMMAPSVAWAWLLALIVACLGKSRRAAVLHLVGLICVCCVLVAYLKVFRKLPERVLLPLGMSVLCCGLWLWMLRVAGHGNGTVTGWNWKAALGIIVIGLGSGQLLWNDLQRAQRERQHARLIQQEIFQARQKHAGPALLWGTDLLSGFQPFSQQSELMNWDWNFLDGMQRNPAYRRWLAAHGWRDIVQGIRESSELRIWSHPQYVKQLELFLKEHFGAGWKFIPEGKYRTFTVFRAQRPVLTGSSNVTKHGM